MATENPPSRSQTFVNDSVVQRTSPETHAWDRLLGIVLPLASVAVLLICCILGSAKKEIWVDEVFTLQLVTDRSLSHMLHALAQGVDGGMPLYYLLAYGWGKVFGISLLSFRMLSSLSLDAGVLLLWATLRRVYSLPAVSLAIASTTITSALLLYQNVEARYYGFYFACAAVVFGIHPWLTQAQPSRRVLIAAILAHAALVMSHPFGLLYSGAAIAGLAITDRRLFRRLRAKLYASLISSWLVMLIWIPPIIRLHDVATPHNWPQMPTLTEVFSLFAFSSPGVVFGLLFWVGMTALAPPAMDSQHASDRSRALVIHSVAYLLPPMVVALLSLRSSSFFVDRYFLPSLIGSATIIAFLADGSLKSIRVNPAVRAVWLLLFVVLLSWPIVSISKVEDHRFQVMDKNIPGGLPVIVTEANVFLPLDYLSHRPDHPYYYVLDWESALHSTNRGATVDYKLMRNARDSGYHTERILDSKLALCKFNSFLVLENERFAWFQNRVFSNPDFQVEHVGDFATDRQLWVVKRVSDSSSCSPGLLHP